MGVWASATTPAEMCPPWSRKFQLQPRFVFFSVRSIKIVLIISTVYCCIVRFNAVIYILPFYARTLSSFK